jgi:hypothetical protein
MKYEWIQFNIPLFWFKIIPNELCYCDVYYSCHAKLYYMSLQYCNKSKSQLTSPTPAQAASCCVISETYSISLNLLFSFWSVLTILRRDVASTTKNHTFCLGKKWCTSWYYNTAAATFSTKNTTICVHILSIICPVARVAFNCLTNRRQLLVFSCRLYHIVMMMMIVVIIMLMCNTIIIVLDVDPWKMSAQRLFDLKRPSSLLINSLRCCHQEPVQFCT